MKARNFEDLTAPEVLALAVAIERANAIRLRTFSEMFRGYEEGVADRFEELAREEEEHERILMEHFRRRFGQEVPRVNEQDVRGVIESHDIQDGEHLIFDSLKPQVVYQIALSAELAAQGFYERAASRASDPELISLYQELAGMEDEHKSWLKERISRESRAQRKK